MINKVLPAMVNPHRLLTRAWKAFPVGSFHSRLEYDIFPRPHYAYCVYQAARLAQYLGIPRISVVEFGVAGGNGLVALDKIAEEVESQVETKIEIYGFDTGKGLPAPLDYRDLPYIWQEGFFEMDIKALEARLSRAKLVIGDVKDTVPTFFGGDQTPAPLGAMMMDLDYYSSTRDAFQIFATDPQHRLPRIFCYMDDVISTDLGILSDDVGQRLAIAEYNRMHETSKLAQVAGFRHTRRIPSMWNDQIYVHHDFQHPLYNHYIHPEKRRQLSLKS